MIKKNDIPKFNNFPDYNSMKGYGGDIGVYGVLKWLFDNGNYPKYNMTLRFKDSSNNPVSNITVTINHDGNIQTHNTDTQGIVKFGGLRAGHYIISVSDGASLDPNVITIIDQDIDTIIVYDPITPRRYTAVLTIKSFDDGTPITNKNITIDDQRSNTTTEKTNNKGVVIFKNLEELEYLITAEGGILDPDNMDIVDQDISMECTYTRT